jgi:separase
VPTSTDEHMFLALDKNVSCFPWESIPILRGRAVSRIPSLPFLLDQVELLRHLPSTVQAGKPNGTVNGHANGMTATSHSVPFDGKRKIDTRRVFYILNSSGDLTRTQAYFEPWLATLKDRGWKGIVGRSPTEMEMIEALTNYDLVLWVVSFPR